MLLEDRKGIIRSSKCRGIIGTLLLMLWAIFFGWDPDLPVFAQEKAVKKAESAIVTIRFYDSEGRMLHQGSGFYINKEGDVITKRPLFKGVQKADVRTKDGMLYAVKGVISGNKEASLIRVSVEIPSRSVSPIPASLPFPSMSQPLLAIGTSSGVVKLSAYGLVSALREIPGIGKVIQVTPALPSTVDGNPVINMKGRMVGVAIVEWIEGRSVHFVIPTEIVLRLLPSRKGIPLSEWEASRDEAAEESYAKGLPFLWKEEYEKALPFFLEAVKKDPRDAMAYFQIGYCNAQLGVYQDALKAYRQAISLKPGFVMAHLLLGLTYIELGDGESALKEYRALKELDEGYAKSLLDMIQ